MVVICDLNVFLNLATRYFGASFCSCISLHLVVVLSLSGCDIRVILAL